MVLIFKIEELMSPDEIDFLIESYLKNDKNSSKVSRLVDTVKTRYLYKKRAFTRGLYVRKTSLTRDQIDYMIWSHYKRNRLKEGFNTLQLVEESGLSLEYLNSLR